MAVIKPRPPNISDPQDSQSPQPERAYTPMGERFRVSSSHQQSRRITRKSAMPLPFDDKHLKKLLDHFCTAERLSSWVQSAPVVQVLKDWVQNTLQCPEHDDTYRSLLLPAESEEKWSDFKEDCVHIAFTRIKGEDLGEPGPDLPTLAWAYAIEQMVRDSWRDVPSGPLNGGQKPGQFKLSGWPCERACDLLHTVYEDLRGEPISGYFANLLGAFTGQRHLHLPAQSRSRSTPKPACETCRFNHTACDRAEPVCGQCKHLKALCTKAGPATSDTTTGDDDELVSYPFDPLFDDSPPRSEPLLELVSRLEPATATGLRSESRFVEPVFSKMSFSTTLPNSPACRTCRLKHRGCDRVRPTCGECSLHFVDCVWDRDGAGAGTGAGKALAVPLRAMEFSKRLPNIVSDALEEGEIDENIDRVRSPQSSGLKRRALGGGGISPVAKRPRPSGSTLMKALLSSVPKAIATQPAHRAPIAPMMAPLILPTIPPSTFGKVHSDRLAQIGEPSPEKPAPPVRAAGTGSNRVEVSAVRASSVKAETVEMPNGLAQARTKPVPSQLHTPFSGAAHTGVRLSKKQRKKLANGPRPPPNQPNVASGAIRTSIPSFEEIRLSNTLQYCKTLFDDILAGRNATSAAEMGATTIQHALGKN